MRQKPAKFNFYRDHQIRLSRDGKFSVDSLTGEWPTLADAKMAIDAALHREVRINVLRDSRGYSDGKVPELQPAVYLGPDVTHERRARVEIKANGQTYKTTCSLSELLPDTPEVRAAWKRYQKLRREAYVKDHEADKARDAIKAFEP
jgi:hypothetical protein